MINANALIPCRLKNIRSKGCLCKPVQHVGKICFIDHFLVFLHPRHMSVAEKRNTVGAQLDHLSHRMSDLLKVLQGQAVEGINVERSNARGS